MTARRPAVGWAALGLTALAALIVQAREGDRPAPSFAAPIARAARSVVKVRSEGGRPRADAARWHLLRRVATRRAGAGCVLGSGIVLTHASLALFDGARYEVTDPRGVRHAARLLHLDPQREVAVLRVEGLTAPPIQAADSAALAPGSLVLALGDPFGVAQDARPAATLGSLEGRVRLEAVEVSYPGDVLLTSAAVNPGSEGGPLIDLEGHVLGILAPLAYDRRLGANPSPLVEPELRGYAIPIEVARDAVATALGQPRRLGLSGRPGATGLEVVTVAPGGPADRAGVRPGDVILAAGDRGETPIRTAADLRRAIADAGEAPLALVLERSGRRRQVRVGAGEDR